MGIPAASVLSRVLNNTAHSHKPLRATATALTNKIITHLDAGRLRKAVSILFAAPEPVPFSLYANLFQLCSQSRALTETRKVESHLLTFNQTPPVFLLNRAIEAYGKCGCLVDARELFDEMPKRDGGSWNALITAYAWNGLAEEALGVFKEMNGLGWWGSEVTFASVIGCCAAALEVWLAREVHCLVLKYGFCGNVILGSSLVDVYGKCGVMDDARRVFDEIPSPNAVSWNVIVRRYLEMGCGREAVEMFFRMFRGDVRPLSFTFSNALVACSSECALCEGLQIHGALIKFGHKGDDVVSTSLIDMYLKCGELEDARRVFDQPDSKDLISWTSIVSGYAMSGRTREARELFNEMPERSVISWNVMLAGYIRYSQWEEALDFVHLMRRTTEEIDDVTVTSILNVCAALSDMDMGKQVHGFVHRHGFDSNISVSNALLDMYGKCGNLKSARVWFHQMSQWRDSVSWNVLLNCYARHHMSEQAMLIFWEMQQETKPNKYTCGTLLSACANINALQEGKQIHGFMVRNGFDLDIVLRGGLIDMYSKCRYLEYALRIFGTAASRDLILWNSIILGCSHYRRGKEVLELFRLMEDEGIKPDHATFQGILHACVCEGLVKQGREFFNSMSNKYCIIPRLEHYEFMIDLYSLHGIMDDLVDFVKEMPFELTVSMLTKIYDAANRNENLKLRKWATTRLNQLDV